MRRPWRRSGSDRALESAAALVAKGQILAAISLLTKANRAARDVRIEAQLVDLRYQAYAEASHPGERPDLPEAVDDFFPGAVIPEIDPSSLTTEAVRSAIHCHGSLIVRGLLDQERVKQIVADIDQVFDAYDARIQERDSPERDAWFRPFEHEDSFERGFLRQTGGVLAVDAPRAMFDVIEAFEESGIGNLVRSYFSEPAALLAKKWVLRRIPHDAAPADWHQDGSFMGKDIRSLDVWVALSHCGDDSPGLDIVGRRFDDIVERGTEGAHLKWTVGQGVVERVAEGTVVRPIFEPGDALLFDHMNLHCTAVEPGMTRDRYAIEAWFFAPSTYGSMTNIYSDDGEMRIAADQIPIVY